jgi:drug/metabolite transporter (DMT)-like permease
MKEIIKPINNKNIANTGIFYTITSAFIFSIMNALIKKVAVTIPSNEIVFFRSSIGTILILFFMMKGKVKFSKKGIFMLATRGICGALYMILYFFAIASIPLLDAIILINTSPIFSIFLSRIFLKEKPPLSVYITMPIVLIGVFLIIKPFRFSTFTIIAFIVLLAAFFAAGAGICIRYLGQRYHTYEIIFYFMAMSTLVSIPLMWKEFIMPQQIEWFYLICIGIVSLIAQVFLTKAFTHENAVVVEVVRYIGIVFNGIWGVIFWFEIPDLSTILGAILIIGGCVLMTRMGILNPEKLPVKKGK